MSLKYKPTWQLPPMRTAGVAKMSMAKLWGDGSSVSQQRERLLDETQVFFFIITLQPRVE